MDKQDICGGSIGCLIIQEYTVERETLPLGTGDTAVMVEIKSIKSAGNIQGNT